MEENASKVIRQLEAQGQTIKKVKINLEELIIWCNENNLSLIGASRANYAAYILEQRNK